MPDEVEAAEIIRVATPEDALLLVELIGAFRDHLGAAEPSDALLAATLPAGIAHPTVELYVAFGLDERPQGYAHSRFSWSIWAAGPAAHLEDLFVVEAERGRGLGERLLAFATRRARERGARTMTLHTNENNRGAQAFYRRLGFRPQTETAWQGGGEQLWARPLDPDVRGEGGPD